MYLSVVMGATLGREPFMHCWSMIYDTMQLGFLSIVRILDMPVAQVEA